MFELQQHEMSVESEFWREKTNEMNPINGLDITLDDVIK